MTGVNDSIREFLDGLHYGTLATLNDDNSIHQTPVWYLFDDESFFVSSGSSSRKVRNVVSRPQASIVVDCRRKQGDERWVSASGSTEIIEGEKSKEIHSKILSRYITKDGLDNPHLRQVFEAAGEVVIRIKPDRWASWELKSLDDQYFGGILRQTPEKWFNQID
jgi:PPOX class probable F420-dependent enzyme